MSTSWDRRSFFGADGGLCLAFAPLDFWAQRLDFVTLGHYFGGTKFLNVWGGLCACDLWGLVSCAGSLGDILAAISVVFGVGGRYD